MHQMWITRTGVPEVLEQRESTDPQPGPGAVRVRVDVAGVNIADVTIEARIELMSGEGTA